jgi:hypothetical protein
VRVVAGLVGLGVLAAAAHVTIASSGGYGSSHAVLTLAIAAGVGVGATVIGGAWSQGRRGLAFALILALLCGEVFGLAQTAERLIAQRELTQAPAREAERVRQGLVVALQALAQERGQLRSPRLDAALAMQREVAATVAAKVAEKSCAANCRTLLEDQTRAAKTEVDDARTSFDSDLKTLDTRIASERARLDAWRAPPSGTMLADRLGWAPWALDLIMAALGSLGANGLAATLLAFAAHRRVEPRQDMANDAVALPVVAVDDTPRQIETTAPTPVADQATTAPEPEREPERGSVVVLPPRPVLEKPVGNVVEFMKECCVFAPEDELIIEQDVVIDAYRQWCRAQKTGAHDDATLGKMFDMICEKTGLTRRRHGETVYWLGVKIDPPRKKRTRRA